MTLLICLLTISYMSTTCSFPFDSYFNITDWVVSEFLKKEWLCRSSRCCSCDPHLCILTGTCCIDTFWNSSYTNVDGYLKDLVKITKDGYNKDLKCLNVFPYMTQVGYKTLAYYMIASCLPDASGSDEEKCHSAELNFDLTPVIGDDGYLYRNSYCAKCNLVGNFR